MYVLTEDEEDEYTAICKQLAFHEAFSFQAKQEESFVILHCSYLILLRYCCWIYVLINQLSHVLCNFVVCVKYRPLWLWGQEGLGMCKRVVSKQNSAIDVVAISHNCHYKLFLMFLCKFILFQLFLTPQYCPFILQNNLYYF